MKKTSQALRPIGKAVVPSVDNCGYPKPAMTGFIAMEYYALILNRTFIVFITPEALYGWKVSGPVSAFRPSYFEQYRKTLNDADVRAVQEHAASRGGFVVPRSEILSVEYVPGAKWGMGPIPHTGRINLRLASGKTRELILLGYVNAEQIKQEILSGVPARQDPTTEVRNNPI